MGVLEKGAVVHVKHQTRKNVLEHIKKTRRQRDMEHVEKYDAQRSITDELRSIWKCGLTLSLVFDTSAQSKLKLKENGESKS